MSSSTSDLLDRAEGKSLTRIIIEGLGATIFAAFASAAAGIEVLFDLVILTPANVLMDVLEESAFAFIVEPLGIIIEGAEASQNSVGEFGILGYIAGIVVVLAGYMLIARYLNERETTDLPFPGIQVDLIPWVGVEEEGDADE